MERVTTLISLANLPTTSRRSSVGVIVQAFDCTRCEWSFQFPPGTGVMESLMKSRAGRDMVAGIVGIFLLLNNAVIADMIKCRG